ncbi:uncharacterized protein LOC119662115 [Teleopsis dalmanni]|uniref:uncharacterized protein LOC119662115 n=1 Tax=Teleopsis dalmanni TaxID=139649 RepID=UPI0018CFC107|nr:uncharacterized protein LOC119662115 [Teleopsis dalmanni]XP_037927598.1 uncharacterized protein LOC119662115 [Teleopsis dalmanni]
MDSMPFDFGIVDSTLLDPPDVFEKVSTSDCKPFIFEEDVVRQKWKDLTKIEDHVVRALDNLGDVFHLIIDESGNPTNVRRSTEKSLNSIMKAGKNIENFCRDMPEELDDFSTNSHKRLSTLRLKFLTRENMMLQVEFDKSIKLSEKHKQENLELLERKSGTGLGSKHKSKNDFNGVIDAAFP